MCCLCSVITYIVSDGKVKEVTNISYVDDIDETVKIYNSNVMDTGKYQYTTGGRVLSMVSVSNTMQLALEKCI